MNRKKLSEEIANQAGISKKDGDKALKALLNIISEELKKENRIQIVGFGTFEISKRKAREGRNPFTGEKTIIVAKKVPKFKAGKALKDYINIP